MSLILFTREDLKKHPICKILVENSNVKEAHNIRDYFKILKNIFKYKFIITDPIVSLLLPPKQIEYFFSLEIYDKQVENNSFKNILRNLIFKLFHWYALRISRNIIFPSQLRYNYHKKHHNLKNKKVFICPNFPSINTINFIKNIKTKSLRTKNSILFAGTINRENRGLKELISIKNIIPDVFVSIAGNADKEIIDQFNYLGCLDQKEVLRKMCESEYAFIFYSNENVNTRLSASVKIFEYYLCGCKIVANRNPGLDNMCELIYYYIEDGRLKYNSNYKDNINISNYESSLQKLFNK